MKTSKTHTDLQNQNLSRHRGFTLVELLVVITIVIALAAIVLTLTSKIKTKAQQTNVLSSLRQVAAFSTAYSIENNGNINTYRWPKDKFEATPSWIKNTFWGRLQPYIFPDLPATESTLGKNMRMRFEELFKTKVSTVDRTYDNTVFDGPRAYADTSGIPMPFSFNIKLYPYDQWKTTSSVRDASQVIYAVIGQAHFNETNAKTYVPMATGGAKNANPIYFMPDKKILASFVDGHVESLTAPIPARNFE